MESITAGFSPDYLDYETGLALQRDVHRDVVDGGRGDTLISCEHSPIFTAGKRTEPHERPLTGRVIDVDRGGKITWHGPGQYVGYPIMRLAEPVDVVEFVRMLETRIMRALTPLGVPCERVTGRSGVWVREGDRYSKIAAIGIRVAEKVTMHGFAINCTNDLAPFSEIVPCGIADAGVTTIERVTGRRITPADLHASILRAFDIAETVEPAQPGFTVQPAVPVTIRGAA